MKKTLTVILLIIAVATIGWHRAALAAPAVQPELYCPHISEMKKNATKGNWTAETAQGLWKSYGLSFATRITRFVGAQWVGENVGQITCVYHSEQEFQMQGSTEIQPTLPVLLTFHTLTFQPTVGKWKHIKQGVYNCDSDEKKDCPFKMNVKPPVENIYQEAESLKSDETNSDSLQPPNY